ncbi:hypothetical protein LguiB_002628 [Lonicera macranthoides]
MQHTPFFLSSFAILCSLTAHTHRVADQACTAASRSSRLTKDSSPLTPGRLTAHESRLDTQDCVFDLVAKYGAKPDTEISQIYEALLTAWKEACAAPTPSTIVIPKGTFLLNQVSIEGPCKAPITLRLEAILKAPADLAQLKPDLEWVCFRNIDQFTMTGGGTFDGQGKAAWANNDCKATGKCNKLPNNLSLNFLTNTVIQEITSLDSKLFHVNVLGCKNISFVRFTITAPGDSLNTDGIHIGRSTGVKIMESDIKTGDDCVSIGDGSQQVTIEKVTCGPGHGIAVGSLGKYPKEEPVVGIFVRNCTITGTDNGVRVKTWPASEPGEASDIHFEDIIMNNVSNPILIDQEYCPSGQCTKQIPSKVKISKVSFKNIRGTSGTQLAVKIVCSQGIPCDCVEVADIDLTYSGKEGPATSLCANVKPTFIGKINPPACAAPAQPA